MALDNHLSSLPPFCHSYNGKNNTLSFEKCYKGFGLLNKDNKVDALVAEDVELQYITRLLLKGLE